jgi:hypothetical protein
MGMKKDDIDRMIKQIAQDIIRVQPMDCGAFFAPYIPLIIAKPKSKYNFSRAKWYEAEWECSDWKNNGAMLEWCEQQFGAHPKNPDAWSRWYLFRSGCIRFRDEQDYVLFVLRWS